jgi:hypothetical protein
MGNGNLENYQVDFLLEGKMVFDWLDSSTSSSSSVTEVVPYNGNKKGQCSPCGP